MTFDALLLASGEIDEPTVRMLEVRLCCSRECLSATIAIQALHGRLHHSPSCPRSQHCCSSGCSADCHRRLLKWLAPGLPSMRCNCSLRVLVLGSSEGYKRPNPYSRLQERKDAARFEVLNPTLQAMMPISERNCKLSIRSNYTRPMNEPLCSGWDPPAGFSAF